MQFGANLLLPALVFSLAGCATPPLPQTHQTMSSTEIRSDNGSQMTLNVIYELKTSISQPTDTNLRMINRSDTAAATGLKTLHVLVGMFAGGVQETSFSKEQLKGTPVMSEVNPSLTYMAPKLTDNVKNQMQSSAPTVYKKPVEIYVNNWYLVYENLSGGDNYELHYKTTISKGGESAKMVGFDVVCEPEAVKAPLADWQANNYKKLHDVTKIYMDTCLNDFDKKFKSFVNGTSNTDKTITLQ